MLHSLIAKSKCAHISLAPRGFFCVLGMKFKGFVQSKRQIEKQTFRIPSTMPNAWVLKKYMHVFRPAGPTKVRSPRFFRRKSDHRIDGSFKKFTLTLAI